MSFSTNVFKYLEANPARACRGVSVGVGGVLRMQVLDTAFVDLGHDARVIEGQVNDLSLDPTRADLSHADPAAAQL